MDVHLQLWDYSIIICSSSAMFIKVGPLLQDHKPQHAFSQLILDENSLRRRASETSWVSTQEKVVSSSFAVLRRDFSARIVEKWITVMSWTHLSKRSMHFSTTQSTVIIAKLIVVPLKLHRFLWNIFLLFALELQLRQSRLYSLDRCFRNIDAS